MHLKNVFVNESVEKVRDLLQHLDDGCEHGHYFRLYDDESEESSCHLNKFEKLKGTL